MGSPAARAWRISKEINVEFGAWQFHIDVFKVNNLKFEVLVRLVNYYLKIINSNRLGFETVLKEGVSSYEASINCSERRRNYDFSSIIGFLQFQQSSWNSHVIADNERKGDKSPNTKVTNSVVLCYQNVILRPLACRTAGTSVAKKFDFSLDTSIVLLIISKFVIKS